MDDKLCNGLGLVVRSGLPLNFTNCGSMDGLIYSWLVSCLPVKLWIVYFVSWLVAQLHLAVMCF